MTFIDRPGMSQVRQAMPSWSTSNLKLARSIGQTRSMMVAVPIPAPMQSVTRAVACWRRSSSSRTVPEQHRARGAERVAERDRAAVDVDPVGIEPECLEVAQHHRREGLVDFEQVDVAERHAGPAEQLVGDVDGSGEHQGRIGADVGEGPDPGPRRPAEPLAGVARSDQDRCGAVDDAGRIARVMDVLDALDVRMRLDRHGVEAGGLAQRSEGRLEGAERLHVGLRPQVLVAIEDRETVHVPHRHDRAREAALGPGGGGAAWLWTA